MTYEHDIPEYAMLPAREPKERVIVPAGKGTVYSQVQVTNIKEKPKTTIIIEEDILVPDTKPDLRQILMIDGSASLSSRELSPMQRKDDYISITLTDEIDPYKPKEQLERIFSHILEIRVDNQRTRTKLKEMDEELVMKDPFTSFAEFYKEMQGREMNGEEETIMKEIFDKAKGVE